MSAESDDAPLVDVELSHSSDGSHEHSLQDFQYPSTKPSATIKLYYPNGIPHLPAADEQSLIPDLDPTEELSLMTKSGWTSEPVSSAQPALTTQLTDDSSPKTETFIHPISGGAITWKDHNEFVFRKGKARGPRVPAPTLPENYKSKGSLKNLDFSKLRGNNAKKGPLTKFLDEYSGKQDQTPTELVTKILAYYNNTDDHLKYLADKGLQIQGLDDKIGVQEQEISAMGIAEPATVKNNSAERGEKIKELTQDLKDRDEMINDLMSKIHKLEEGNFTTMTSDREEFIKTLMLKINELEEADRERKEELPMTSQNPDSAKQGKRIKELEKDVRERENTINDLFVKIHKLEEASEEATRKQKEESSKPDKAVREKEIGELDQNVEDRDNIISALSLKIQELEAADHARKEAQPKSSQDPVLLARKMTGNAKAIKVSLLELIVRCLLLQAKDYIDNKEHPAAADVMARAEVIMYQELPHLKVLYGKVLYRNGRAMYEMGFLPEAILDLTRALEMGFDADCGEVDGDCVRPWLVRARNAHSMAVKSGYPAG